MAKSRAAPSKTPEERPLLLVDRETARTKIAAQMAKGNDLLARQFSTKEEFDSTHKEYYRWDSYNTEMIRTFFNTAKFADEYRGIGLGGGTYHSLQEEVYHFRDDLNYDLHKLQSLVDRLELIPEDPEVTKSVVVSESQPLPNPSKVFIVHGHDNLAKESAARFVETFGLEAVILHEQTDGGKTIIEKVEAFSDVGFVIVLLTPDDVGNSKVAHSVDGALYGRARQNVVFEHGYFVGKLGRGRVVAMLKGGVEVPSDLQGVVYTKMDEHDAWKTKIAKEMKAAGLAVDLNRL